MGTSTPESHIVIIQICLKHKNVGLFFVTCPGSYSSLVSGVELLSCRVFVTLEVIYLSPNLSELIHMRHLGHCLAHVLSEVSYRCPYPKGGGCGVSGGRGTEGTRRNVSRGG